MVQLSLRQDHFSSEIKKFLGPTLPFLNFKNSDTFTQIQEKRPYQPSVSARFRDTYAPTSRKGVSPESKARSFQ